MKESKVFPSMWEWTSDLLSTGEVAELAGVCHATVLRDIEKENLRAIRKSTVVMTGLKKPGRRPKFLIHIEDVHDYVEYRKAKKLRAKNRRCKK